MLLFFGENLIEKVNSKFDFGLLIGALLYMSFIFLIIFHLTYFFTFYFKSLSIKDKNLSIFELNKFKVTKLKPNEIKGYSKSEVYFGKYMWKSKSIIIYSKNGIKYEFVSVFITKLNELENEMKRNRIKYLGFEDYQTGWFYRKYKFEK